MSQAYKKHKVCYLTIDKCATGTLDRYLPKLFNETPVHIQRPQGPTPSTGKFQVKASEIKKQYPTHFLFTFIRNPYDRVVLRDKLSERIGITANLRPQTWYIDIPLSKFDFIGRVETLNEDIATLRKIFDLPQVGIGERIHKSHGKKNFKSYYTEQDVNMITMRYKRDVDLLGYKRILI